MSSTFCLRRTNGLFYPSLSSSFVIALFYLLKIAMDPRPLSSPNHSSSTTVTLVFGTESYIVEETILRRGCPTLLNTVDGNEGPIVSPSPCLSLHPTILSLAVTSHSPRALTSQSLISPDLAAATTNHLPPSLQPVYHRRPPGVSPQRRLHSPPLPNLAPHRRHQHGIDLSRRSTQGPEPPRRRRRPGPGHFQVPRFRGCDRQHARVPGGRW